LLLIAKVRVDVHIREAGQQVLAASLDHNRACRPMFFRPMALQPADDAVLHDDIPMREYLLPLHRHHIHIGKYHRRGLGRTQRNRQQNGG
jgi:hypothetical protein